MDINIGVRLGLGNLKGAAGQISSTLLGEQRKIEAGNRSAGKSFDNISQGAKKAGLSMQQIGTAAAHANATISSSTGKSTSLLNRMGGTAGSVTSAVHRIGGASSSVGKVGDAASATAKKLDTAGTAGAKAGSNISKGMSGASSAVGELSGLIGGLIAGFGAVEIGTSMVTGAMDKQFNQAYLSMHLGTQQAAAMTKEIQNIVAAVPGDDTFMNTLLVDAAVRNASLQDMQDLAVLAADYMAASQKTGMSMIEAQQDLNAYVLTGNTAELQRSRILTGQLDKLEGKATVQERIKALQEALNANNLGGLSTLDVAKIKWEAIRGRIQMAATNLGEKFLPYLESAFDWFINIDDKTNGIAGQLAVAGGLMLALAASAGIVVQVLSPLKGIFTGAVGGAKTLLEKLGVIKKTPCDKTCTTTSTTECKTTGGGTGTGQQQGWPQIPWGALIPAGAGGTLMSAAGPLAGILAAAGIGVGAGYSGQSIGNKFGFSQSQIDTTMGIMGIIPGMGTANLAGQQVAGKNVSEIDRFLAAMPGGMYAKGVMEQGSEFLYSAFPELKNWKWPKLPPFPEIKWPKLPDWLKIPDWGVKLPDWLKLPEIKFPEIKFPSWEEIMGVFTPEEMGKMFREGIIVPITSTAEDMFKDAKKWYNDAKRWVSKNITTPITSTADDMAKKALKWYNQARSWLMRTVITPVTSTAASMYSTAVNYYNKARNWISRNITIPIWSTIQSAYSTAVYWYNRIRGVLSNPISIFGIFRGSGGPGTGTGGGGGSAFGPINTTARGPFDQTANAVISGLSYEGYGGHQKSIAEVFGSCGGNCVDTSLALLNIAGLMGHHGELISTTWNGTPHIATKIGGKIYDPANKMLTGNWNLPPAGPGGYHGPMITVIVEGPIYGMDDFDKKIENGMDKVIRKYGF
jgi:hypothetical protein